MCLLLCLPIDNFDARLGSLTFCSQSARRMVAELLGHCHWCIQGAIFERMCVCVCGCGCVADLISRRPRLFFDSRIPIQGIHTMFAGLLTKPPTEVPSPPVLSATEPKTSSLPDQLGSQEREAAVEEQLRLRKTGEQSPESSRSEHCAVTWAGVGEGLRREKLWMWCKYRSRSLVVRTCQPQRGLGSATNYYGAEK